MHIIVDGRSSPRLEQASDFTSFSVKAADPTPVAVLSALSTAGTSADEADHVFVDVQAVRSWALAAGVDSEPWEQGYSKMLAYAASKGWMNADASAIKAHIEATDD
ncbi:MAG: hypothetical protein O3C27_17090 [Actinomycetota bacterium]|nr:hypothetical protein [Actinomycetota bacterium]